jgi:2,5-diamino-6-(ribosylamino)-4(3H)-pyrimidinone 5'-phosphate reductase
MLPRVKINVAMSLNGKISSENGRYKISDADDMERVHLLRKSVDAVLVGANTVMVDDPVLHHSRCRIVLDGEFRLSERYKIFDGSIKTYIVSRKDKHIDNVQTVTVNSTEIRGIMEKLYSLGIKSVLVEGGVQVINEFIDANLFEQFFIYVNPGLILSGKSLFPSVDKRMEYTMEKYGRGILLSIKSIHI